MKQKVTKPEKVGMSRERLERIRPAMQTFVDSGSFAGLSTMIARKGKVVHFEQVGQMDKEANVPMSADAIFRIYSMTKPIVSVALMTLYEHGKFLLDDPVGKFIPAFNDLKVFDSYQDGELKTVDLDRPVTIKHLLTHTSGLTYDFLEDSPVSEIYRQARLMNDASRTLEEMIDQLAQLPLAYQPGTIWHYSVGIDVAARLVEIISGQTLGDYLQKTIFAPLKMKDTRFAVPDKKLSRLATMYGLPDIGGMGNSMSTFGEAWLNGFNERLDVSQTNPTDQPETFARGGHGLFSTAWDYMRFAQMLLNGGELNGAKILGRKTIDLMVINHLPASLLPFKVADPPNYGYGFGLGSRVLMDVAESQIPGSVGEHGWAGAASTYFWIDPQEELIGIMLSQAMVYPEKPQNVLQILAYQALVD
ncbi:MAG: CubicO group peptidase (beta-lactamase class C family) [Cellvibrionaceae bacterium]|jgi:CubicO group peptidase (beta-lactamase class C family)